MPKEARAFIGDPTDLRWGAKFLGALLAIPVAGILGLPLLTLLLLLFWCNPYRMGERLSNWQILKTLPGFRSGKRSSLALACLLYLLPLSILGMLVISVDGLLLGIWS